MQKEKKIMKDIVNLINLTENQSKTLLSIYQNCKTYKIRYIYPKLTQSELLWPETLEEHNWIVEKIVAHFDLTVDEIVDLPYNKEDPKNRKNYIDIPYYPSCINFVHFYPGDYLDYHNNHSFHMEITGRINIPVLNVDKGRLEFKHSKNFSRYPSPILINERHLHRTSSMRERLRVDRVFLSLMLKNPFSFYYKKLKWNSLQENPENSL